jgi:hypothetical protein
MCLTQGRVFYPLDPQADEIFIEDIAFSLSRQNRYNGLSDQIVNIAQHSVNSSWLADMEGRDPRVQLAMLMHDAPEMIVGDLIRPVKMNLPDFVTMEESVMNVINDRFHLPIIPHKLMKYYDNLAWAWEKRDMFKSACRPWPNTLELPNWVPTMITWTPQFAEHRFLQLFHWLQKEVSTYDGWNEGDLITR